MFIRAPNRTHEGEYPFFIRCKFNYNHLARFYLFNRHIKIWDGEAVAYRFYVTNKDARFFSVWDIKLSGIPIAILWLSGDELDRVNFTAPKFFDRKHTNNSP